ncbi:MAG: hypothetical protein AAB383_02735 [Patescibacteria group bacterium]
MSHASRLVKGTVLASLLLLSSCTFLDELKSNLSGEETEVYDDYSFSASDSLNRYIDLLNAGHDNVSSLEDSLYYLEDDILYYDPGVYEPTFYCYFDYESYDTTLAYDVENPVGLTTEEISNLGAQGTGILSTLSQLKTLCEDINRHVTAQDYKDDDFVALYAKMDEAYLLIDSYYTAHNELLEDVDEAFSVYSSWEVDPSDPISVGIDNMDKDMDKADEILDVIDTNLIAGTTDGVAAQVQTLYDALQLTVTEHASYEPGESVSYYYDTFYTEIDQTFLPIVKRSIRNFEAADLTSVDWDYSDLLDSYNYMVDDYNYYLDYSGY